MLIPIPETKYSLLEVTCCAGTAWIQGKIFSTPEPLASRLRTFKEVIF